MTAEVPPQVQAAADEAGFGPLVARITHPNADGTKSLYVIFGGCAACSR